MKVRNIISRDAWVRRAYRDTKDSYYNWRESRFLSRTLADLYHFNCYPDPTPPLLLITVAYNRADMIRYQLSLLSKHLSDPFVHVVIDNSKDKSARKEIASVCYERSTGYVSLPPNFYKSSNSHGMALNWAYQHIVNGITPQYVGFLDHDIFPVRTHSILEILKLQPLYGQKEMRNKVSYLWPGFSFYRTSLLDANSVDFKPGVVKDTMVDTGGLMPLADLLGDDSGFQFAKGYYVNEADDTTLPLPASAVEWLAVDDIDTWLHCIGAGRWRYTESKAKAISETIENNLR